MTATHNPTATQRLTPLAAGGPDPDRVDWAEAWYPIHYVVDLDKAKPTRFTLQEQDV